MTTNNRDKIIFTSRKKYALPRREVERIVAKQMGYKVKRKKTRRKLRLTKQFVDVQEKMNRISPIP